MVLSILLHGVISLPDATSNDKSMLWSDYFFFQLVQSAQIFPKWFFSINTWRMFWNFWNMIDVHMKFWFKMVDWTVPPEVSCRWKQCESWSAGFIRSQLNWFTRFSKEGIEVWKCYAQNTLFTSNRAQDKCVIKNYFSYSSTKTYVVGTQKNHLNEAFLLSTKIYVITDG